MAFPWMLAANIGATAIPAIYGLFGRTSDPFGAYAQGGIYGPERMRELLTPSNFRVNAPSPAAGIRYGEATMDLASRGARVQAGAAANTLSPGMNPSARISALGQISQQAAGGVGAAGVGGYQSGLDAMLRANAFSASNALSAENMYQDALTRSMDAGALADQLRRARIQSIFDSMGSLGGTINDWYNNRKKQLNPAQDFQNQFSSIWG